MLWPLVRWAWFISDDGLFHLYRLSSLAKHVKAGHLYPRWFADFAFGYGHPILNYYAPLSYYLALVLRIMVGNPILAMKGLIILGFIASAWGMYLLGREMGGEEAGWLAALLYTYFPYHLADVYTRGAIPEAMAFAAPPFILWAWWKASQENSKGYYFIIGSVAWALLVLTHSLSVLLMAPLVGMWLIALAWQHRVSWKGLLKFAFALGLGTMLGAFYWLPARVELGYVYIGHAGISRGYERHLLDVISLLKPNFLYPYTPAGAPAQHPLPTVFILAGIVGGIALGKARPRIWPSLLVFWVTLAGSMLMRWEGALPLWHTLEAWLDVLQYPWRFLLLTAISTSLLGSGFIHFLKALCNRWGIPEAIAWVIPVLLFPLVAMVRLPVRPLSLTPYDLRAEAMWRTDFNNRQIGATWTAEFVPFWVKADRTAVPLPRLPGEPLPTPVKAVPHLIPERQRPLESRWLISTPDEVNLIWHQFYFPGWEVRIDGHQIPVKPVGPLGLLSWKVPPGEHRMSISFRDTPARKIAALVSLAALMVLILWIRRERPGALKGMGVATGLTLILLEIFLYPFKPASLPHPVS
ncbi:MAG: hypothetical protein DRI61_11955, partial [Chloroflexi bacterium]